MNTTHPNTENANELPLCPPFEDAYFVRDNQIFRAARKGCGCTPVRPFKHGGRWTARLRVRLRFGRSMQFRVDYQREIERAKSWATKGFGVVRPRHWVEEGWMTGSQWEWAKENPDFYVPND